MQTLIKSISIFSLAIILSTQAFAGQSRAVKKAKEAVAEAAEYDWKTLAKSAEICFNKGENIEEALVWIEKSIEIQKDPFNLQVLGDYYASIGDKKTAMAKYYEAITVAKDQNFWYDTSSIQAKIWELK